LRVSVAHPFDGGPVSKKLLELEIEKEESGMRKS
jgi:hypothetical protein